MSDGRVDGPVMLAITNILRTPPLRIGRLTEDIVFPRTVELRKLVAVAAGVLTGMFLWFFPVGLLTGYSLLSLAIMVALAGFAGLMAVSWSPIRGESLLVWLGLSAEKFSGDRVLIEGRRVRAYLGVAPLPFTAAGAVRMFPGAVDVPAGSVDDRGVPVSPRDQMRRLFADSGVVPAEVPTQGFDAPRSLRT